MHPESKATSVKESAVPPTRRTVRVAVPTAAVGGLAAAVSAHFGRSPSFTVVELVDGETAKVVLLENPPHGDCQDPVALLQTHGVEVLIVHGMGMRPRATCRQAGIDVLVGSGRTVGDFIAAYRAGSLAVIDESNTCGRRGGPQHH
jgi:predicted Fe-Mo cluster-binding NifX family protein